MSIVQSRVYVLYISQGAGPADTIWRKNVLPVLEFTGEPVRLLLAQPCDTLRLQLPEKMVGVG